MRWDQGMGKARRGGPHPSCGEEISEGFLEEEHEAWAAGGRKVEVVPQGQEEHELRPRGHVGKGIHITL